MKTAGFTYLIKKSIFDTHQYLFRPFSLSKWAALLVVALFAGVLSGGFNFGLREQVKNRVPQSQSGIFHAAQKVQPHVPGVFSSIQNFDFLKSETSLVNWARTLWRSAFGKVAVAFLILIFLIAPWLIARFSFVWFHDVMHRSAQIREPFNKFQKQGNSFFLAALIANLMFVLVISTAFVSLGSEAHLSLKLMIKTMELPVLIVTLFLLSIALFNWVARDFVVPIMATDASRFWPAWSSFVSLYRKNRKEFWSYFLLTLGLKLITGIASMLVAAIWLMVIMLFAGALFLIPYLVFNVFLIQLEFIFWCYAVLVGIPFLLLIVASSLAVNLPFAVFFRFFSLYFLSSLDGHYQLLSVKPDESET